MLNFFNLPYKPADFSDKISVETFAFHYGKHHKTYFDSLLKLISGTDLEKQSLIEIMSKSFQQENLKLVYNNAAQVFNHDFYWQSLTPKRKEPSKFLLKKIEEAFSSLLNFKEELKKVALSQFGSGWAWVVLEGHDLKIISTSNAVNPLNQNQTPLLTIDVWEHAYYIDYRNKRAEYLDVVINELLNWDFMEANMKNSFGI
jgi:superoxide dismutase, Fe-Mn family